MSERERVDLVLPVPMHACMHAWVAGVEGEEACLWCVCGWVFSDDGRRRRDDRGGGGVRPSRLNR